MPERTSTRYIYIQMSGWGRAKERSQLCRIYSPRVPFWFAAVDLNWWLAPSVACPRGVRVRDAVITPLMFDRSCRNQRESLQGKTDRPLIIPTQNVCIYSFLFTACRVMHPSILEHGVCSLNCSSWSPASRGDRGGRQGNKNSTVNLRECLKNKCLPPPICKHIWLDSVLSTISFTSLSLSLAWLLFQLQKVHVT